MRKVQWVIPVNSLPSNQPNKGWLDNSEVIIWYFYEVLTAIKTQNVQVLDKILRPNHLLNDHWVLDKTVGPYLNLDTQLLQVEGMPMGEEVAL